MTDRELAILDGLETLERCYARQAERTQDKLDAARHTFDRVRFELSAIKRQHAEFERRLARVLPGAQLGELP